MAVPGLTDDTRAAFADILCADPEWVQTEFERLVTEALAGVVTDTMPDARDAGHPSFLETLCPTGTSGGLRKRLEKVRSPPRGAGRVRP